MNPVILAKQKIRATATGEKNEGLFSPPASTEYILPSSLNKKNHTNKQNPTQNRKKSPIGYLSKFLKLFILYYVFIFRAQPAERTHRRDSSTGSGEQDGSVHEWGAASLQFITEMPSRREDEAYTWTQQEETMKKPLGILVANSRPWTLESRTPSLWTR